MKTLIDTQLFSIRVYRGSQRVGKICFEIGIRAIEGKVSFLADDPELNDALCGALNKQRYWNWKDLTRRLIDHLSLNTNGRYILRFGTTPSEEGRGGVETKLRRAINRAVNE